MQTYEFFAAVSEWLGVIALTLLVKISPRFRHRPVGFQFPRREGLVASALFALSLALAWLAFSSGVNLAGLFSADPNRFILQRLVLLVLTLVPFAVALAVRGQPLRSAGWGKTTLRASLLLGLSLALLTIFLRGKIYAILDGFSTSEIIALPVLLACAVAQETIFRGYLQLRFCSWLGGRTGWVVTALLFTLWTFIILTLAPVWASSLPVALMITLVRGLILGWLARQSGSVLAPALYLAVSDWMAILS